MKYRIDIEDDLTIETLQQQIANGGRFVVFPYCMSFIITCIRPLSQAVFVKDEVQMAKEKSFYKNLSRVFGWWSIWGISYTIQCIKICNAGGTDVTDDIMLNLKDGDLAKKEVNIERTTILFVKPGGAERKALVKVINSKLDASLLIDKMVVGLYINTGHRPYYVIGIATKRDYDRTVQEVMKALHTVFLKNAVHFTFADLNNNTDVVDNDIALKTVLLEQGEVMIGN
jgi:hypothetical protein